MPDNPSNNRQDPGGGTPPPTEPPPVETPAEPSPGTPTPAPAADENVCQAGPLGEREAAPGHEPGPGRHEAVAPQSEPVQQDNDSGAARLAALIYGGASLLVALIFLAVTTLTGSYPPVARYGGAVWIFILVMIVLMPMVIPRVNKRRRL